MMTEKAVSEMSFEEAMAALEEVFARTMPPEMGFDYSGMSYQEKQAAEGVPPMAIFAMSLLFVFLILAAQYESWSLPLAVILVVPMCLLCSIVGVALARGDSIEAARAIARDATEAIGIELA